jgi:serine/threonine-protein kinase HipA
VQCAGSGAAKGARFATAILSKREYRLGRQWRHIRSQRQEHQIATFAYLKYGSQPSGSSETTKGGSLPGIASRAHRDHAERFGMPPALLVERFDIREGADDHRLLAMEDFCSVLDLSPEAKYEGTIERVARALRGLSTSPDEDLLTLMKRVVFAWLIADGDMHLKNMALLKIAEPGNPAFRSVRLAPVYDTLTTRVFPRLEHDRMALKLNGKDERLKRADFLALSATAGLRASDTQAAMDDVLERMRVAVGAITLPRVPGYGASSEAAVIRTLELCRERVASFA